jgi:hypothetical protein
MKLTVQGSGDNTVITDESPYKGSMELVENPSEAPSE